MSSVRCPRARCSRTRRMAAGNAFVSRWSDGELDGVLGELRDRRALVAAVEVAQEVAAVLAVHRRAGRGASASVLSDEADAVVPGQAPGGQPRVRGHDVRRDERVLEVEGGDVAGGVEHLPAQPVLAVLAGPTAPASSAPGVLDDRRQVDPRGVVVPVDDPGVEREGGLVVRRAATRTAPAACRRRRPPRTRRTRRRARRRCAARSTSARCSSSLRRQLGLLAPQRQRLQRLLGRVDHLLSPSRAGPAPGRGRGRSTRARRSADASRS